MMLPFFILFVLQLWTDKKFQIAWKYTCACTWTCRFNKECCNKCCHRICCCCYCCTCCINYTKRLCKVFCIFLHHIMKAVFIGLLWVASVLIDGDWYVCCWNDQSKQQKQLACKAETDMTAMERKIIAELKDWSWVIGISLLFGALFLAALMSSFGRIKCGEDSACCNRKNLYYKVILEEEKDVLREILTKTAKEKLAEDFGNKIRGKQWEGCFDVAKDLIKAEENQENELEMTEVRRLTEEEPGPSSDP
ncbi:uncharacterized protein LOC123974517 [Micropterus dolomieu]|uniref:uncharacterized protein LOC123974517 n=1 Tax=Micropterus dolomieu TaxID=147949 RepID=UPI001E8CFA73|nr:uncharacterized protein LOC123974517 [Micropterus dolomieu]